MDRRKSKHKEKLNIAMFGQKRIPSREGGVEIVVEELCSRMVAQGHNVTCYNRGGHHVSGSEYDSKRLKEYKGIRLKTVPTIEKKGLAAVSSSFFAALCCAFGRYDIVHIHAEGPAFFAWLPKLFGKKVIVTIHGLDWQREKWKSGFGSKFIHHGEKNAVKYADEIIVLSKGVQDYFEKEYGRKTVFIPNGVNRPKIQEAELITEKYGLEKDSYILFLGRLVPEKGIRYLVETFKNVKTDKKLVIAGGSSDTDSFMNELKDLAKDDDRIIFTGFVQGQILKELYSKGSSLKTKIVYGGVEWFCSWMTDGIITINKEDYTQMKKMACKNVYHINGVGVDTSRYHECQIDRDRYRESLGLSESDIAILEVGELSTRKNHKVIIEALSKINDKHYVFLICGKAMSNLGTYDFLKKYAEEKNVRVIFLGFRKDIPEINRCVDIAVLPSLREGLGLAGIEALASGVPVVGSNVQGIKDYVIDGKTGYLCSPRDADAFADKIQLLSDKEARFSMRKACVEKAEEFRLDISHQQMKNIYKNLLHEQERVK